MQSVLMDETTGRKCKKNERSLESRVALEFGGWRRRGLVVVGLSVMGVGEDQKNIRKCKDGET